MPTLQAWWRIGHAPVDIFKSLSNICAFRMNFSYVKFLWTDNLFKKKEIEIDMNRNELEWRKKIQGDENKPSPIKFVLPKKKKATTRFSPNQVLTTCPSFCMIDLCWRQIVNSPLRDHNMECSDYWGHIEYQDKLGDSRKTKNKLKEENKKIDQALQLLDILCLCLFSYCNLWANELPCSH